MRNILSRYLSSLHVPHTAAGCRAVYQGNPYKNSMYGLAEMLHEYGIPTKALRFEKDESEHTPIPVPSLAVYDKEFVIIENVSDGMVTYLAGSKRLRIKYQDFLKGWDGVALKGTPDASSGETGYRHNHFIERAAKAKGILAVIALAVVVISIVNSGSFELGWWGIAALLINLAGIYVSYLLILKQLHIENPVAEHLCGLIKSSRCDSPKLTEASTILGMVTLSEIGAGFFIVNTLVLLLFPALMSSMALLSAVGLLFSFWSVWYQKTQARTWCTLCLIVLTLMWTQAAIYLLGGVYRRGDLLSINIIPMFAFYAVAIFAISYIMEEIGRAIKEHASCEEYNELRLLPDVMRLLIRKSPELDKTPELQSSMVFGKEKGGHPKITVFSNPYCSHCANLHKELNRFLASHPDASIRYTMTYFSPGKSIINRYIIAAFLKEGPEKTWQLLTEWYGRGMDQGESFFSDMGLDPNADEVLKEFAKQDKWREATGLTATPVIIVDGHKLPHGYTASDLEYLSD